MYSYWTLIQCLQLLMRQTGLIVCNISYSSLCSPGFLQWNCIQMKTTLRVLKIKRMWNNMSGGKRFHKDKEAEMWMWRKIKMAYTLCCFSLGVVGVQVFLQLQHTKLQSLQQSTRDQLQQHRTPHILSHKNIHYIHIMAPRPRVSVSWSLLNDKLVFICFDCVAVTTNLSHSQF